MPLPPPGTERFEQLLRHLERLGLPSVGIGRRWGPRVPQIGAPRPDAPDLRAIDRDMERVAKARWIWAQPWHPRTATADNAGQRRVAEKRAEEAGEWPPGDWQPARRPSQQMAASAYVVLDGASQQQVGEMLELRGSVTSHRLGTARFRTVDVAVDRGHDLWAALGAWPWAALEDGRPPGDWWTLDAPVIALRDWALRRANTLEQRARMIRGTFG